jgi:hypothetical protein
MESSLTNHRFQRERHQVIGDLLERFNPDFLCCEGIGFGGGTRIALELDEYRESVDIDLICPSTASYRAVRQTIGEHDLGALLRLPVTLAREVRTTRDKVVTAIEHAGHVVKLEIISFADWQLGMVDHPLFPIPVLDQAACFTSKLTAANDRGRAPPYKDVVDLIVMQAYWGAIPDAAVREAERHYGRTVLPRAQAAIAHFLELSDADLSKVTRTLGMKHDFFEHLDRPAKPTCDGGL